MKKLAILAILIVSMFLVGCAYTQIGADADDKEAEKTSTKTREISSKTTTADEDEEEEGEELRVKDTSTGETVTLKKIPDYRRDRDVTEKCDMDFPLECVKFLAKDGIEYLTIKNTGYTSKLNQVTLTLNNDECDPVETFIEPGQNKDFECFEDPDENGIVVGNLEIEYYSPIEQKHDSKSGVLVVRME
jgi:hypothetical protein